MLYPTCAGELTVVMNGESRISRPPTTPPPFPIQQCNVSQAAFLRDLTPTIESEFVQDPCVSQEQTPKNKKIPKKKFPKTRSSVRGI